MREEITVYHPLKYITVKAVIKYNSSKEPVEIKYEDGYKITNQFYIEDILYENKIINQKSKQW